MPAVSIGELVGRSVVITGTGATIGLGRSLPIAFADAGADLTLNYLGQDPRAYDHFLGELHDRGAHVVAIEGDISDGGVATGLIDAASQAHGAVDVLINNAAISTPARLLDMGPEAWQRTLDVNLTAAYYTTRAALDIMIAQRRGRIINIASQIAQKGGVEHAHYAAAKAGLIGFTKSVAREVGEYGITANCLAPGPIRTALMDNVSPQWQRDKLAELVIPRFGTPEEVVPAALLLASDPGGNLFTGQTLGPNCGDVMP
jgi:3-oxoacyl-[acyl-carrier protein] reductase